MSTEANKASYRRFFEEIFNQHKLGQIGEYIADDKVEHSPGLSSGAAGVRSDIETLLRAFHDMRATIDDLTAEGDKLASRYSWTGTHRGEFSGIAPTGKQVTVMGHDLWRLRDGKCAEHWNIEDNLGLMQQLGVVPAR